MFKQKTEQGQTILKPRHKGPAGSNGADISRKNWHTIPHDEVMRQFESCRQRGLTESQVEKRLEQYGSNALPAHKPPTVLQIFLHQFRSPLIYILFIAAIVCILIGDMKDAIFIFAVLLLNAFLGTIQEWKAEKGAAALQSLMQTQAHVLRDGERIDIPQGELVPGDIVFLESGNKVPADVRLLEANNLSIDESLLTGESLPVEKNVSTLEDPALPVGDRRNMAYAGSLIIQGRGVGVVVATGLQTEVGQIAESVTAADVTKTPLIIRMERFTRRIAVVVLVGTFILGGVALIQGMPAMDALFFAIALSVAAIPEGLPVVMTVALSIATQRMARRNVIVRKLPAVEGLGSCTYIVSDKTGTLTVNRQTLRQVLLPDGQRFKVSGEGYHGEGEVTPVSGEYLSDAQYRSLAGLARAGILCNEGDLHYRPAKGDWSHQGDAVDIALLAFGYKLHLAPDEIRNAVEVAGEIPYESERGYAAVFYRENDTVKVAIKGAGEHLLPFCEQALIDGERRPMDRAEVERQVNTFAEEGYRVLVIAEGEMPAGHTGPFGPEELPPLTLLGFIGMIDPLRPEAGEAVRRCREAGIHVAMVTGDHPATAMSIARELGIAESREDIITGAELEALFNEDPAQGAEKIRDIRVFARVGPLQKLTIVETLIDQGHFVAVTGDGVNDAPALKKANIGVAMGSGSDIAKDISTIIVTDDNFATIEAGVEEGRFAYANIRKVIWFLISNGTAMIVLSLLALFLGMPLPLIPVQILWANLVTCGIQDIALAFEAGEPEVMKRPPYKPTESIFNRPMVVQTLVPGLTMGVVCFGVFCWFLQAGYELEQARNLTLLALVLMENYHAGNCRSQHRSVFRVPLRDNYVLVAGVLIAHGLHLLAMNLPLFQDILELSPVSFIEWLELALLASTVLIAVEIFKFFRRRSDYHESNGGARS